MCCVTPRDILRAARGGWRPAAALHLQRVASQLGGAPVALRHPSLRGSSYILWLQPHQALHASNYPARPFLLMQHETRASLFHWGRARVEQSRGGAGRGELCAALCVCCAVCGVLCWRPPTAFVGPCGSLSIRGYWSTHYAAICIAPRPGWAAPLCGGGPWRHRGACALMCCGQEGAWPCVRRPRPSGRR